MIRLYSTLTRTKETLTPIEPGKVGMYLCGPTVYDDCHIGHLMGPVLFDAIARWLNARGLSTRFVINITDIDDKIIDRANRTGEHWESITARYTQQYFDFLTELHVGSVTDHPRCTEYVPKMVEFIQGLVDQDRAYATEDGVYFDVQKQPGYGKLSGRKVEDMLSGERVAAGAELRHPADFALWKSAKPGEPSWDSPWGKGRPGWHIECSVMASELLGSAFDIHAGGDDLKFPHHENEIAQSEAHGDAYAKHWLHNGLIQYGGKKIAKSDPRMKDEAFAQQFQARWLIDKYGAPGVRFFLLRGHYRRPIDFDPANLDAAAKGLGRLHDQLGPLLDEPGEVSLAAILAAEHEPEVRARIDRFCATMDDDFNTSEAVAELFGLAKLANARDGSAREAVLRTVRDLGRLLGLMQVGDRRTASTGDGDGMLDAVMQVMLNLRAEARADKNFALSDRIRDALAEVGIEIKDGKDGATWSRGSL